MSKVNKDTIARIGRIKKELSERAEERGFIDVPEGRVKVAKGRSKKIRRAIFAKLEATLLPEIHATIMDVLKKKKFKVIEDGKDVTPQFAQIAGRTLIGATVVEENPLRLRTTNKGKEIEIDVTKPESVRAYFESMGTETEFVQNVRGLYDFVLTHDKKF